MFATRLRAWRFQNDLSRAAASELLGFSESTLQSWECNHKLPSYTALLDVADGIGVSVDYLMGRTDRWQINR